jgi:hypothetical protein
MASRVAVEGYFKPWCEWFVYLTCEGGEVGLYFPLGKKFSPCFLVKES